MAESVFNPVKDIREFHEKFGLEYKGKSRVLVGELGEFRHKFMMEELVEYRASHIAAEQERLRAPSARDAANYAYHLESQLDALVDLVYVALGTAYLHGWSEEFEEAWRRVHAANMSKVRATRKEDSKRGSTFDVVKPPGWEPPSHIDLVEDNDLMEGN